MLKEVSEKEALKAYMEGKDVLLVEGISKDKDRNPLAFDLTQLFKGKHFLIEDKAGAGSGAAAAAGAGTAGRVDVGKIKALHNAGWTNKAIADEMGINPITVGKYVKQFSEKTTEPEE